MTTEQPATLIVPTEMSRPDGFFDLAFLVGTGLAAWWLALRGVPIWLFVPVLLCLSVFVLTGEPAGDVPFIGALAAGLRSKLGLRRAHEWCAAWWHYTAVRTIPDFQTWSKTTWQNSRLRSKMLTVTRSSGWRRITSASRVNMLPRWCTRLWRRLRARTVLTANRSSAADLEPLRPN